MCVSLVGESDLSEVLCSAVRAAGSSVPTNEFHKVRV